MKSFYRRYYKDNIQARQNVVDKADRYALMSRLVEYVALLREFTGRLFPPRAIEFVKLNAIL
jgi:hypothetical protein